MTHKALVLLTFAALTVPRFAPSALGQSDRSYSYAYIRYSEGEVTLQRAMEPEPSPADANVPIMPGDRAWTGASGRAEVLFADGSVLRMDERTKMDFAAFGETAGTDTLLRLWNGSIILRVADASATTFRVDTPSGAVFPVSEGLFRIDVDEAAAVTLSAYEGVAELASEAGSILVRSGQRSFVRSGLRPESPFEFNTARWDEFSSWSDGREQTYRRTERIEGVPAEIAVYAGDLERHGDWRYDTSMGYVWYPTVSIGWSPYTYGRWSYTSFGWTWISDEPWGWAPYHYGRWGQGSFGWYWIPGAYWGPAWVSWAFGPSWIGWCPLGYYDRPVVAYHSAFQSRGGDAVPRHESGPGWSFVKEEHFASRSVERTRLRVEDIGASADHGRVLESGAILDREFRPSVVGPAAMTRVSRGGLAGLEARTSPSVATRGELATSRGRVLWSRESTGSTAAGGQAVLRGSPASGSRGSEVSTSERFQPGAESAGGRASVRTLRGTSSAPPPSPKSAGVATSLRRIGPGALRDGPETPITTGPFSPTVREGSPFTGSSEGSGSTSPATEVTRRPATERSKGSSAGSKDFFSRRPASVGGSGSSVSSSTARPRTESSSQSSRGSSSARGRTNVPDRGSSKPRN